MVTGGYEVGNFVKLQDLENKFGKFEVGKFGQVEVVKIVEVQVVKIVEVWLGHLDKPKGLNAFELKSRNKWKKGDLPFHKTQK